MIQINLFTSAGKESRLPITKAALNEFANIKDANKEDIELYIYHNSEQESLWQSIAETIVEKGISVVLASMPTDTYIDKVRVAHKSTAEYCCKWDDDVFINRHVWDYMIENINILENPEVSMLTPVLSNGMPSVDMFIEDFLTEEETQQAHSIFIKDNIDPNIFGCNYEILYNAIASTDTWDGRKYWELVESIDPTANRTGLPWFYTIVKGIHPARFSYDFNMFLANHAINNIDKLLEKGNFYLDKDFPTPYLCDNLFFSKTEFYRKSQELFFDHWDEGQVNMLSQKQGQTPIYVRNCYGIHMAYGCTKRQAEIETYYLDNLFSKLI